MVWNQGVENGKMIRYHKNGQVETDGYLTDGKENGRWEFYYLSGVKSSFEIFENGLLVDSSFSYYENGKIQAKGYYIQGLKHGKFEYYDSLTGKLDGIQIFVKDSLVKTINK